MFTIIKNHSRVTFLIANTAVRLIAMKEPLQRDRSSSREILRNRSVVNEFDYYERLRNNSDSLLRHYIWSLVIVSLMMSRWKMVSVQRDLVTALQVRSLVLPSRGESSVQKISLVRFFSLCQHNCLIAQFSSILSFISPHS